MAKVTGAELLRALRTEADPVSGIADRLRQAVETVTDPTAAEACYRQTGRSQGGRAQSGADSQGRCQDRESQPGNAIVPHEPRGTRARPRKIA